VSEKVVIDPVTRIEGHLRIEVLAEGDQITDAWSQTTQFKGVEIVLRGRDPRDAWAFAQRICGVCTVVHAIASIRAVEDALAYPVPKAADIIRNLVLGSQMVQDHVIHFYHLHALDFVNVAKVPEADVDAAVAAAVALEPNYALNSVGRFQAVQDQVRRILESGQLSIFTNGYWDHPDYRLSPEVDLIAVSHYLDALVWQRDMIRINTIFGGKNPHPNFLVGGMASAINMDNELTINQVKLDQLQALVERTLTFVQDVYLPDVVAILGGYPDYLDIGRSSPNFLAVGKGVYNCAGYPAPPNGFRPGVILDGKLEVVDLDLDRIKEFATSGWYRYPQEGIGLQPWDGETEPQYTGPVPPYEWLADNERYTWSKAPRYDGRAVQVGPMPRLLSAYVQGEAETRDDLDPLLRQFGATPEQLNSTAGRILARAVEAVQIARQLQGWLDDLVTAITSGDDRTFNPDKWEKETWPTESKGVGFAEVARGTLSHWVRVNDGFIENYQAVVPSTWNGCGRATEQLGPYEQALVPHPLLRPEQPLEPLRTIHSFDPCQSCGIHVLDVSGAEVAWAQVQ
jgi:hydrogenase large subunit